MSTQNNENEIENTVEDEAAKAKQAKLIALRRELYLEMLYTDVLEIDFIKVDGSLRKMLCTLNPILLPKVEIDESIEPKKERKINPNIIKCYDLEAKGWRSFRLDSIVDFTLSIEQNAKWGLI